MLQNAFTFNVAFEEQSHADSFADASLAIGTRMLYQLQDLHPWETFRLNPANHLTPSSVFSRLGRLKGLPPHQLCVILCVDNLDNLDLQSGNSASQFHYGLGTLCDLVNASKCWVLATASATSYKPVDNFFSMSSQWHLHLQPAMLARPKIQGEDVFLGYGSDALVQLLVDDMGGFSRCLEVLYTVMQSIGQNGTFDFAKVLKRVVKALFEAYPAILTSIDAMREAFLAAVARRVVYKSTMFGNATLDQVISAGLIRLRDAFLQCPYVLYLMLTADGNPWREFDSYVPVDSRQDILPQQAWDEFYSKFRVLKSMAFAPESPLLWGIVHSGARLGSGFDRFVREVPRKVELAPLGSCTCDLDSENRFCYTRMRRGRRLDVPFFA